MASNSQGSFPGLWGDVGILCKNEIGEIVPWDSDGISLLPSRISANQVIVGQDPSTAPLIEPPLEKYH